MSRLPLWICLLALPSIAKEWPISGPDALSAVLKSVSAGDTIVISTGEWRDAKLVLEARGRAAAPITLKAATPGRSVFTGKSTLRIAGEHLIVDGLHFRDPDPAAGEVIEFRVNSKRVAHFSRLTNCAVTLSGNRAAKDAPDSHWVNLYGSHNRVDHCRIEGKTNGGATLVVWLGPDQAGAHRIDHNYFGPREKLGRNGGETIRVGDSQTSMQSAACTIEQNLFEQCDGELECISNKSCENTYRENTFRRVSGTLTLRHGNRCLVERNTFLGEGATGSGGIRVIGEDHVVRENRLEGLAGSDSRAALCLMMGIPGSKPHEYFQVKRARIERNVVTGCASSILIGMSGDRQRATLPPEEIVFWGNRILSPKRTVVETRTSLAGVTWKENVFFGAALGIPPTDGIQWQEPKTDAPKPIDRQTVGADWLR